MVSESATRRLLKWLAIKSYRNAYWSTASTESIEIICKYAYPKLYYHHRISVMVARPYIHSFNTVKAAEEIILQNYQTQADCKII